MHISYSLKDKVIKGGHVLQHLVCLNSVRVKNGMQVYRKEVILTLFRVGLLLSHSIWNIQYLRCS